LDGQRQALRRNIYITAAVENAGLPPSQPSQPSQAEPNGNGFNRLSADEPMTVDVTVERLPSSTVTAFQLKSNDNDGDDGDDANFPTESVGRGNGTLKESRRPLCPNFPRGTEQ
jgi:hypothetical protein